MIWQLFREVQFVLLFLANPPIASCLLPDPWDVWNNSGCLKEKQVLLVVLLVQPDLVSKTQTTTGTEHHLAPASRSVEPPYWT